MVILKTKLTLQRWVSSIHWCKDPHRRVYIMVGHHKKSDWFDETYRKPLDESERGQWKTWLKTQHSENLDHGIWSHHFMQIDGETVSG